MFCTISLTLGRASVMAAVEPSTAVSVRMLRYASMRRADTPPVATSAGVTSLEPFAAIALSYSDVRRDVASL